MKTHQEILKLIEEGNHQAAIDEANRNIAFMSGDLSVSPELLVDALCDLYYAYFCAGDFEKALESNADAIVLKLKSLLIPEAVTTKLYYDRARIHESLEHYEQALESYADLVATSRRADVLYRMALCYHALNLNVFADSYYHEAYLAMGLTEGNYSLKTAMVLRDWGVFQLDDKQYMKALSSFGAVRSMLSWAQVTDSESSSDIENLIAQARQALVPHKVESPQQSIFLISEIYHSEPLEPLFDIGLPEDEETQLIATPPISPMTLSNSLKN